MKLKNLIYTALVMVGTMMIPVVSFGQVQGTANIDGLIIRQNPMPDAEEVMQLSKGDTIEIIDQENEQWLKILVNEEETAFVYGEFVDVEVAEGTITGDNVRLRTYPDTNDSQIIKKMNKGDAATIEYVVGDWCKITQDGQEGFVSKDYIASAYMGQLEHKELEEVEPIPGYEKNEIADEKQTSSVGEAIVADAMQFVGGPYRFGGNSLTNGIDCSGFAQQIMSRAGISISRSSSSQYASNGYSISRSELQAGDLVFYGYNGKVSHVAIYAGNGQIVHAGTSATGIHVTSLNGAGKPYIGAKRVL